MSDKTIDHPKDKPLSEQLSSGQLTDFVERDDFSEKEYEELLGNLEALWTIKHYPGPVTDIHQHYKSGRIRVNVDVLEEKLASFPQDKFAMYLVKERVGRAAALEHKGFSLFREIPGILRPREKFGVIGRNPHGLFIAIAYLSLFPVAWIAENTYHHLFGTDPRTMHKDWKKEEFRISNARGYNPMRRMQKGEIPPELQK
eukprot:TRINITY_DN1290_c0_g1_i1.p1 TRINITY_DN1290_c0_g1~~TRINITY_DN1290_c0_g1_i1.p1  ORF type:complete len:232 (-),score=51.25 TRINITY_DN1290_c0_g1_i1:165-764(-)